MDKFVNQINIAEGHEKGFEEGQIEGINQRNIEIAKNLLSMNMNIKDIASATGLTEKESNSLKD